MHPTLENLRELQQVDTLILQLKKKQTQLNDGSALKKELETVQSNLTKASEKLRNSKAEQQDSELKLKTIESKKKNYERKLHSGEVSSSKELVSIEHEIALINETKDQLEDRILTLMDEIEDLSGQVESLQQKSNTLKDQISATLSEYKSQVEAIKTEIEKESALRIKAAEKVDPVILKRYESIRARGGGIGLATVVDKGCSACHTTLTSYALREVRESVTIITCENCNRILIPSEE